MKRRYYGKCKKCGAETINGECTYCFEEIEKESENVQTMNAVVQKVSLATLSLLRIQLIL